jgi:hypothetical protein
VRGPGSFNAGNFMILKIAFVSEKHYPALSRACEPGVIGKNYADYLMMINECREESRALGIPFEIIRINPDTFALWCGKKPATWADLLHYTGSVFPGKEQITEDVERLFFRNSPSRPESRWSPQQAGVS